MSRRLQSLYRACGSEIQLASPLGHWMQVMSRVRDGDPTVRNRKALSLLRGAGGQIALSSPIGAAAMRMSLQAVTLQGAEVISPDATAVEGERSLVGKWFAARGTVCAACD